MVRYGTESGEYSSTSNGYWFSYQYKKYISGALHMVEIDNLIADTTYYYQCGNEQDGWSDEYTFTTAPRYSNTTIDFILFGDINLGGFVGANGTTWNISHYTLEYVSNEITDLVIDVGDIAYCSGDQTCWDNFFIDIEPVAATKAYMTCYGNHDVDPEPFGFRNRFKMPGNRTVSEDSEDYYYSFDYGPVHFVAFSTELFFLPINATVSLNQQMLWLQDDLLNASLNRHQVPWIIVFGHRPLYCSDTYPDCSMNVSLSLQRALEPLFFKYQVDLLFAGHMHSMETTYPITFDGAVAGTMEQPEGTIHVTSGAAGMDFLGPFYPAPSYSRFRSLTHGYSRLMVTWDTLQHQFIATNNGTVVDEFTIENQWWRTDFI